MKLHEIKNLNESSSEFTTDPKAIRKWLAMPNFKLKGTSIIEEDGTVNIHGNLEISMNIEKLPFKFGTVSGIFHLYDMPLKTLEGCPATADHFVAQSLEITNLEHCPKITSRIDLLNCKKLTSLEGFSSVKSSLSIAISGNKKLTSLKGIENVRSCVLNASGNNLKSLDFIPRVIKADTGKAPCLQLDFNKRLKSLIGIADKFDSITGSVYINPDDITSGGMGFVLIPGDFRIHLETSGSDSASAFEIIKKYIGRPDDIFECQMELMDNGFDAWAQL